MSKLGAGIQVAATADSRIPRQIARFGIDHIAQHHEDAKDKRKQAKVHAPMTILP